MEILAEELAHLLLGAAGVARWRELRAERLGGHEPEAGSAEVGRGKSLAAPRLTASATDRLCRRMTSWRDCRSPPAATPSNEPALPWP